MKIKFYLIFKYLFVTFLAINVNAQSDSSLVFIERAVQYERIIFEEKNKSSVDEAILGKLNLLITYKDYTNAIKFIDANINQASSNSLKAKFIEKKVWLLYITEDYNESLLTIQNIPTLIENQVNYKWLYFLKSLNLIEKNNWQEAKATLQENRPLYLIYDSVKIDSLFGKYPTLKSEKKAGWLATFLPGSGLIYAKKPVEGITNIVLISGFLYFGWYYFLQKQYLTSWLIGGGLAGSFYMGGVRRTERVVTDYNKKVLLKYNIQIKKKLLDYFKDKL
jgi:hypothetical protein